MSKEATPTMLEQAIVDAKALKDAAVKNAENILLERYANDIEKAVNSILEQEDMAPMSAASLSMPSPASGKSDISSDVPLAATDNETLCPCQDEDEEIEIDFDELEKQMLMHNPEDEEMLGREDLTQDLALPEEEEDMLEEDLELTEEDLSLLSEDELDEGWNYKRDKERARLEPEIGSPKRDDEDEEELEENNDAVELSEAEIESIVDDILREKLSVDTTPEKSGWYGSNETELKLAREQEAAKSNDDEVKEEMEALKKSFKQLQENFKNSNSEIIAENKKVKNLLIKAAEQVKETNLLNSKLFYENKILTDSSLNERQKEKMVSAISKAKTVSEAKVIFETLQSAVGEISSRTNKKTPQSLSEAVQRNPSLMVSNRRSAGDEKSTNPTYKRLKLLAGIKQ